jgi:hypothetical protein
MCAPDPTVRLRPDQVPVDTVDCTRAIGRPFIRDGRSEPQPTIAAASFDGPVRWTKPVLERHDRHRN